ncbi:MAG: chorismate synthase [Deltaproteobacteria bacterium]|nr:chorismate synthase [Deltaproteobacteria bacterium]
MSGNTFGVLFRVTTWGESHGAAVGAVIDGCPPNIELAGEDIQRELDRRKPGTVPLTSPRGEEDRVEILSGVFEGRTTGTPIALLIRNRDVDSASYEEIRDVFRPGHGDFTYFEKYGIRDHRGGGRASGRETAARVAAGAVARKVIAREGIDVLGFTVEIGGVTIEKFSPEEIRKNSLLCSDAGAAEKMRERLDAARMEGDSLGGVVEIRVKGCPPGLGEPVFDKIDAELARALMSIGTVKGVEIGAGFRAARMKGSECNDSISPEGFGTNHAGGVLAGISTGAEIVIRAACKPIPSIGMEQETIDIQGRPRRISVRGRHDICVIPRIIPVCEAMVCLVLADQLLRQKGISGSRPARETGTEQSEVGET